MRNNNIYFILLCLVASCLEVKAQSGSTQSFSYLRRPANARVLGIGGENITVMDKDVSMAIYNPALITSDLHTSFSINYQPYLANINATNIAYGHTFKKLGTLVASLQYMSYGEMDNTDATGQVLGTFSPSEYAFAVGTSRTQGVFSFGGNLKFAGSNISGYSSYALLADLGGTFKHPKKDMSVGMLIKNAGFTFSDYTKSSNSTLPFDVQLGLSYKLEHMPLRVSVTAVKLYKYDIRYDDPNKPLPLDLNGDPIPESNTGFDKIMRQTDIVFRHLVFGGEFLMSKNINLRVGYNHMLRREMQVEEIFSMAGFSFGGMIRIAGFEFAYSRTNYHIAGGLNTLSLSTNFMNTFKKKAVAAPVPVAN